MADLNIVLNKYKKDIEDVDRWAEDQYNMYFAQHFAKVRSLHDRLRSAEDPITDDELERVLTWLPLEVISAAEKISKLKTTQEVIKTSIRKKERSIALIARESGISEAKAKEQSNAELADDRMLIAVYDAIIERVNREIAFSKELIMSSKKIWDARRIAEQSMPSIPSEDPSMLPEYDAKPSVYIK